MHNLKLKHLVTCINPPADCFLFGFVQTAEQCQYGDEIGEVADASAQYTMDDKGDLMSCHHQPSKLTPHTYAINNSSDLFCR